MAKNSQHDSDVSFIQALAELLRENDLTELRVKRDYAENDALDVRVSRAAPPAAVPAPIVHAAPQPSAPAAEPRQPDASQDTASAPEDPASHPGAITSPMVGTAYLQPEPGAPAFVSIGQQVKEGDTLLIVEAMKTMNQIPAPRAGTVKRILIEDGAPVEYGAPLMILE
ncbi:acetyl-CoA carboxylase biotin carboxyl carrier protein [Aestuariibius sp. 2305UL40-4]|uniref:acetyl-CoA carboxylase biotin carboxyl carrier protein n=1 Tax=Aestuariibius violaceus TaxID=3234132 RepID=UPI00345F0839